jgi:hypothetical protein
MPLYLNYLMTNRPKIHLIWVSLISLTAYEKTQKTNANLDLSDSRLSPPSLFQVTRSRDAAKRNQGAPH